jgi:hypothetical protein
MPARGRPHAWIPLAAILVAGCQFDGMTAPPIVPRTVVHAVLNPQATEQLILVQQTRQERAGTLSRFDASDPVAGAGGLPIRGARVVIHGPGSDSVVAVEDAAGREDGKGAGVYRVRSRTRVDAGEAGPGVLRLLPGAEYRIVVETLLGTVRGSTRVPAFGHPTKRRQRFNLDRDTLRLDQRPVAGGLLLRHAVPGVSQRDLLTASMNTSLLAPSAGVTPSWAFAFRRREITPGSTQTFVVTAVDSNYYRYFAADADPFGDDTRGNSLVGGVGLFGSVVTLVDVDLDLVADRNHPIEGDWSAGAAGPTLPTTLQLYDSPNFPLVTAAATGTAFSGSARFPDGSEWIADAIVGGGSVTITLRHPRSTVIRIFSGTLAGGVLALTAADGSQAKYHRFQG